MFLFAGAGWRVLSMWSLWFTEGCCNASPVWQNLGNGSLHSVPACQLLSVMGKEDWEGIFFFRLERSRDSGYLRKQGEPCLSGRESVYSHSHSHCSLWRKVNESAGVLNFNFTKADLVVQAGWWCEDSIGINTPVRATELWPVGYLEKSQVLVRHKLWREETLRLALTLSGLLHWWDLQSPQRHTQACS